MTIGAAVVTGGASGFGRAVASCFAASGADVALLDIDGARALDEASTLAADHGVYAIGHQVDVSSAVEVAGAADAVAEHLGRCDLLWVNVGVQHFGSVEATPEAVWRWVLDVNLVGAVRTVQAFLPLLRAADTATIAFTASANVLRRRHDSARIRPASSAWSVWPKPSGSSSPVTASACRSCIPRACSRGISRAVRRLDRRHWGPAR